MHLIFVSDANAAKGVAHPRNLIVAGRHSKATVHRELRLARRQRLLHQRRHRGRGGATARRSRTTRSSARASARSTSRTIDAQPGARQPLRVVLLRDRRRAVAHEHLHACSTARGAARRSTGCTWATASSTSTIRRTSCTRSPTASAARSTRGFSSGSAHGVFNGKVYVHPDRAEDRRQADEQQPAPLRAARSIDTKPQLEIFADDVRCTHGATVGRLDEMALFYMKSRGVARGHGARAVDVRVRGGRARDDRGARRARGARARDAAPLHRRERRAVALPRARGPWPIRPRSTRKSSSTTTAGRATTGRSRMRRSWSAGCNPLCGDELTLWLRMDGDRIADARFEGSGCAISRAVGIDDDGRGEGKDARRGGGAHSSAFASSSPDRRRRRNDLAAGARARSLAWRDSRSA